VDNSSGNLQTTIRNLFPISDRVNFQVLCGNSWDMAAAYDDGSLDFVMIDGDHSYESVRKDIQAWRPKVSPGGILAGHDYVVAEWSGVIEAVNAECERYEIWRGSAWDDGKHYPSWVVRI
jgi:predicted O-methyltransferase YrrM